MALTVVLPITSHGFRTSTRGSLAARWNSASAEICTPGQIMSAVGLIQEGQAGDDPERVREGMSGNLCRCGAYRGITEAVLEAQRRMDQPGRQEAA